MGIKGKLLSAALAAVLALGLCPAAALGDEAAAPGGEGGAARGQGVQVQRLSGRTAADTSAAISAEAFPEGFEWVVLARDDDFADAMSATGLAGQLGAPIVLTDRDGLSEAARGEIERLGAAKCCVVGGRGAMPGAFESELSSMGVAAERVYGSSAADTSVKCASRIASLKRAAGEPLDKAVVATSAGFQDALSVSSFAYAYGVPVFLQTGGATAADRSLTAEGAAALAGEWGGARVYVPGGRGALSEASVEGVLGAGRVTRMSGRTGYDTSAAIADRLTAEGLLTAEHVVFACGAEASKGLDALSGAAYAGRQGGVVLLVNGNGAMEPVDATAQEGFFTECAFAVSSCAVLGGAYVVPEAQKARIQEILDGASAELDVDANHENSVEYKEGVKVLEGVSYAAGPDGSVVADVSTLPEGVRAGDTVVLSPTEDNPEGATLVVSDVAESGGAVVLSGQEAGLGDVFESMDVEGVSAAGAVEVVPSDDVEMVVDAAGGPAARASYDGGIDLGTYTFEVKGTDVSFKINPSSEFRVDMGWGRIRELYLAFSLEEEVGVTLSTDDLPDAEKIDCKVCDVSFATSVPGLFFKLAVWAEVSAEGRVALSVKSEDTLGVHYKAGAFRPVAKSARAEASFEIEAEARAGLDITGSVDILSKPIVDASLGAGAKFELGNIVARDSGLVCADAESALYADIGIGQHDSLLADLGLSWSRDLLDEPFASAHLENGKAVDKCTWDGDDPDPGNDPNQAYRTGSTVSLSGHIEEATWQHSSLGQQVSYIFVLDDPGSFIVDDGTGSEVRYDNVTEVQLWEGSLPDCSRGLPVTVTAEVGYARLNLWQRRDVVFDNCQIEPNSVWIENAKKTLGVPLELPVTMKTYPRSYWEAASLYLVRVEFSYTAPEGTYTASGMLSAETGDAGRSLLAWGIH